MNHRGQLSSPDALHNLTAGDVMTAAPVTVTPDTKLSTVTQLMEERGIQHFPVVDGDRLVAMLGERHLRDAMPSVLTVEDEKARRGFLSVTRVEQVMPKGAPAVHPGTSLAEVIALMRAQRLDGVGVVTAGKLAGIVTAGDLITLLEQILRSAVGWG